MARANSGRIVGTLVFGLVLLVLVPTLILGKLFVATFPPGIREVANKKASSVVYFKPQVVAKSECPVADVPAKSIEGSESLIAKDESTPSFTSTSIPDTIPDTITAVDNLPSDQVLDELFASELDYDLVVERTALTPPTIANKPELSPKVDPPKEPLIVVQSPPVPSLRVWKSPTGKEVEGTLIRVDGDTIEFRTKSGKVVKSSAAFFSEEDQAYIKAFEHLK